MLFGPKPLVQKDLDLAELPILGGDGALGFQIFDGIGSGKQSDITQMYFLSQYILNESFLSNTVETTQTMISIT